MAGRFYDSGVPLDKAANTITEVGVLTILEHPDVQAGLHRALRETPEPLRAKVAAELEPQKLAHHGLETALSGTTLFSQDVLRSLSAS